MINELEFDLINSIFVKNNINYLSMIEFNNLSMIEFNNLSMIAFNDEDKYILLKNVIFVINIQIQKQM